jgi:hypothetical protein
MFGIFNKYIVKFKIFRKMKTLLSVLISLMISASAVSQDTKYRKDERPQNIKEDKHNVYQTDRIGEIEILQALEIPASGYSVSLSPPLLKRNINIPHG